VPYCSDRLVEVDGLSEWLQVKLAELPLVGSVKVPGSTDTGVRS